MLGNTYSKKNITWPFCKSLSCVMAKISTRSPNQLQDVKDPRKKSPSCVWDAQSVPKIYCSTLNIKRKDIFTPLQITSAMHSCSLSAPVDVALSSYLHHLLSSVSYCTSPRTIISTSSFVVLRICDMEQEQWMQSCVFTSTYWNLRVGIGILVTSLAS